MASSVQIVPKYQHPHVETYVYDNTFYTEDSSVEVDDSIKLIAVFSSGKGIDNKFVKKTNLKSFTDTFGKSNPKKYGQPLMMPIAALNTGVASVWCMRVMPTDAAYANSVLSAYYKADVDSKMFTVKYKAKSFTDGEAIYNRDDIEVKGNTVESPDTLDGWTHLPIASIIAMGRGEYGQNYRWRITNNTEYERDYEKKFYTFEILSTENGLSRIATYVGTLVTPTDLQDTVQITDVIADEDMGSYPANIIVYEENVDALYNAYVDFLNQVAEAEPDTEIDIPTVNEFDPFFGLALNSTDALQFFTVQGSDGDDPEAIDLDIATGINFLGGTEGSFSEADPEAAEEALVQAYKDAFGGVTDKLILAPRRIACDFLLDANYPYEVKLALAELAHARNDCMLFLDCGIQSSFSSPTLGQMELDYASGIFHTEDNDIPMVSLNPQHYEVRDIHTGRKTTVTMTYFIAQNLPTHFAENGSHIPFVKSYAELTDFVPNSLAPSVEMFESDLKEELYTHRFNYWESIGESQFQRACQCTAQVGNSDLLEENNVHTLFALKRQLEYDCWINTYNFTSADERARFQQIEEAKFESWKGSRLDTLSIRFDATAWEAERSIVHCYVEVQFRNLHKRTIIEIDINRRNFTA